MKLWERLTFSVGVLEFSLLFYCFNVKSHRSLYLYYPHCVRLADQSGIETRFHIATVSHVDVRYQIDNSS